MPTENCFWTDLIEVDQSCAAAAPPAEELPRIHNDNGQIADTAELMALLGGAYYHGYELVLDDGSVHGLSYDYAGYFLCYPSDGGAYTSYFDQPGTLTSLEGGGSWQVLYSVTWE